MRAVHEPLGATTSQRHKVPKQLGKYRLICKLGQGGMATVFKAQHVIMDRLVALKVLAPGQVQDSNLRTRFMREARLAGRVQHPHVIACYDIGEDHGHLYMALELAEHGDVLGLVRNQVGALPERLALVLMRDCALGLDGIHRVGLLHRDLKPANIFLTSPSTAKLADLGIAKDMRRVTASDAGSGSVIIGTPAYMAPEQARGERPDARSDLYALGATFFHLLTGRLPIEAASSKEVLALLRNRQILDPAQVAPFLAGRVVEIIRRAMAYDPDLRYTHALDLHADIELALAKPTQGVRLGTTRAALRGFDYEAGATVGVVVATP